MQQDIERYPVTLDQSAIQTALPLRCSAVPARRDRTPVYLRGNVCNRGNITRPARKKTDKPVKARPLCHHLSLARRRLSPASDVRPLKRDDRRYR